MEKTQNKFEYFYVLLIVVIIFSLPYVLTRECISFLSFNNTGQIGDTIGGITSPFINILAALLIYITYKNQLDAYQTQKEQYEGQITAQQSHHEGQIKLQQTHHEEQMNAQKEQYEGQITTQQRHHDEQIEIIKKESNYNYLNSLWNDIQRKFDEDFMGENDSVSPCRKVYQLLEAKSAGNYELTEEEFEQEVLGYIVLAQVSLFSFTFYLDELIKLLKYDTDLQRYLANKSLLYFKKGEFSCLEKAQNVSACNKNIDQLIERSLLDYNDYQNKFKNNIKTR